MSKFDDVVKSLLSVLKNTRDLRIAQFCAEYLVAYQLEKKGHDTDVLKKKRGPDIYLKDLAKYIEVKSGHIDLSDWSCAASFRNGKSIKNNEFAYCVFLIFQELEPKEYLVFTVEELKEVAEKPRPYPITAFPNNRCVLFRYNSLKEYEDNMKDYMLDIEVRLHRHPNEFRDRWDKIVG